MQVWLAREYIDYSDAESSSTVNFLGVYATKELANRAVDRRKKLLYDIEQFDDEIYSYTIRPETVIEK